MNSLHDLKRSDVWKTKLFDIPIKIVRWDGFQSSTCRNAPQNNWNYYCYLLESKIRKDLFESSWLEDKIMDWGITHDYYSPAFSVDIYWHGGVTWYQKFPNIPGYRMIEIGCDFQHLFDQERGFEYNLEEVFIECRRTAEELSKMFLINGQNN